MRDRTVELLLAACQECGALALRDAWRELESLAGDRTFTTAEACAHALLPENGRLRAAIEAACGEVSPRKLGKLFARWAGADIAGIVIVAIGEEANAIVWSAKVNPDRTPAANAATVVPLPSLKEQRHAR